MKPFVEKEVIASRNHPSIKHIRNLHNRVARDETGLFCVEGLRFVAQATEQNATLKTIVYAPELLHGTFAYRLLQKQRRRGTRCLAVTPEVLHSLALNDDPQGIVAAAGLLLIGDAVDAYHPACVRATMGALFNLQFVRTSASEFRAWKQRHDCILVGTSPAAALEYNAVSYSSPTVLWMSWERKGLSAQQQQMCDVMVQIPMLGRSDSLNLAVAKGVMLYEVLRQRRGDEK